VTKQGIYCDPVFAEAYYHPASASHYEALTTPETAVLTLLADGKTTKEASQVLGLSARTVEHIRERLKLKVGASSLAALIRHAIRIGLIDL